MEYLVYDDTFPVSYSFCLSISVPHKASPRAPAILHSSSYHCFEIFKKRKTKKKEGKGRNRDRSHISEVTAPAAALSNNPNSVVPGRDYSDRLLSALKLSWRGGGGGYVWSVIKWERGVWDSDMEGWLRVTERGGGGLGV